MPLLMGFYWLCPESGGKRGNIKKVVIEEPEMGLHPQAIQSVILQVIDLMSRGYKVIISTHSPVLLEFAWAFNLLKKAKAKDEALLELFGLRRTVATKRFFENILSKKIINTFYFSRENNKVISKDITTLDPGSEDNSVSEWGGLSYFATKATDIVSKYLNDKKD